jgi:hypothetical protein
MLTQCSADLFGFAPVEGRKVVAAFDAVPGTQDASIIGQSPAHTVPFVGCHFILQQDEGIVIFTISGSSTGDDGFLSEEIDERSFFRLAHRRSHE